MPRLAMGVPDEPLPPKEPEPAPVKPIRKEPDATSETQGVSDGAQKAELSDMMDPKPEPDDSVKLL